MRKEEGFTTGIDDIMRAAQLACCLEVSGYPKPGNVHRLRDFKDTRFEHFLAGSIALGPPVREAAIRGVEIGFGELNLKEAGVGALIRKAVSEVKKWHRGGNTHLGISLLFIPLAISAGVCMARGGIDKNCLQKFFGEVVEATTCRDTVEFYKAVKIAEPGGLGRVRGVGAPDVYEREAESVILERGLTLYEVMKIASSWDLVAWEFANRLEDAFKIGYPFFEKVYEDTGDVNIAVVHTFLKLLSEKTDTLIARKIGLEKTSNVAEAVKIGLEKAAKYSLEARRVLELGGLKTREGRNALEKLDEELAAKNLNPGSTADVLAATLFIALLTGFRP